MKKKQKDYASSDKDLRSLNMCKAAEGRSHYKKEGEPKEHKTIT